MQSPPFVFSEHSLAEVAADRLLRIREALGVLDQPLPDAEELARRFSLLVPVLADTDAIEIERRATDTELWERGVLEILPPGLTVTFAMRYSGDPRFFRVRPEHFEPRWLWLTILSAEIRVTIVRPNLDEEALRRDWQGVRDAVKSALDHLREDVRPFNRELPARIRELLAERVAG